MSYDERIRMLKDKFYPESRAGGFSRVDGSVQFYQRINALVRPEHVVLDVGAGRGEAHQNDLVNYRRELRNFRGKCKRVYGIDIDPVVFENSSVDEARLIERDRFPIDDESIDVAFADFTLEHIHHPGRLTEELIRVLRSGGWFCARTPNRFGYIAIGATIIPNRWHSAMLRRLQPKRKEHDIFPTVYKLNTFPAVRRYFPDDRWNRCVYAMDSEPTYFGAFEPAWHLVRLVHAVTPPMFRTMLYIFCQKK